MSAHPRHGSCLTNHTHVHAQNDVVQCAVSVCGTRTINTFTPKLMWFCLRFRFVGYESRRGLGFAVSIMVHPRTIHTFTPKMMWFSVRFRFVRHEPRRGQWRAVPTIVSSTNHTHVHTQTDVAQCAVSVRETRTEAWVGVCRSRHRFTHSSHSKTWLPSRSMPHRGTPRLGRGAGGEVTPPPWFHPRNNQTFKLKPIRCSVRFRFVGHEPRRGQWCVVHAMLSPTNHTHVHT